MSIFSLQFPLSLPNVQRISSTAAPVATALASYTFTGRNKLKNNFHFLFKNSGGEEGRTERESSAHIQYNTCPWEYLFVHWRLIKQHGVHLSIATLPHSPFCSLFHCFQVLRVKLTHSKVLSSNILAKLYVSLYKKKSSV